MAIVVLNWNGSNETRPCLEALAGVRFRDDVRVILVDNGSTECSPEAFAGIGGASVVALERNHGYAGGNNRGIEAALAQEADFVILLNNDVYVYHDFVAPLVDLAEANPVLGILGPTILNADGTVQFGGAAISPRSLRTTTIRRAKPGVLEATSYMMGCAMMVRRQVFERIGLLDVGFFLYEEEKDFCLRAAEAGFQICITDATAVVHHESSTTARIRGLKAYYRAKSGVRLARKHRRGPARTMAVAAVLGFSVAPRALSALRHRDFESAKSWLIGAWDGVWERHDH